MNPEQRKEFSPRQYAISLGSRIEYIVSHPDEYPETVEAVEEEIQGVLVRFHTQTIQSVRERVEAKIEYNKQYLRKPADGENKFATKRRRANNNYIMGQEQALTDLLKDLEAPTHPTSEISD